ncbi:hypothetical protein N0V82_008522 [Gnomoniopsis sp. IMI 355080]|nr:hypothetical protein N0V82_008522 [Gnomoniopsis sp. IMI 355080]
MALSSAQQSVKHQVVNNLAVAIIFFINGCTTPTKLLLENGKRWKEHLLIQIMCFGLTSATTFAVVSAAATKENVLDPALLNGVVLLGCLPTALAFNTVMTKKANGNAELTLTESVLGSILGPVLTTVLMQGYSSRECWYTSILPKSQGGYSEVFKAAFKQLGLTLFMPLAVGQITLNILPKATETVFTQYKGRKLASIALLILIWSACDSAFETGAIAALGQNNMIFAVFLAVALFIFWLGAAMLASILLHLPRGDVIAAMFCVSTKTPALGLPLITALYAGLDASNSAKLTVPMVLYQCVQTCLSSLATIPLRRWRKEESDPEDAKENSSSDVRQVQEEL